MNLNVMNRNSIKQHLAQTCVHTQWHKLRLQDSDRSHRTKAAACVHTWPGLGGLWSAARGRCHSELDSSMGIWIPSCLADVVKAENGPGQRSSSGRAACSKSNPDFFLLLYIFGATETRALE